VGLALSTLTGCAAKSSPRSPSTSASPSSPRSDDRATLDPCALGELSESYSGDDITQTRSLKPQRDPPAHALLASSIRRELITDVVDSHRDALRACYREGLARDPELRGTITVAWAILDGVTSDVELGKTTLADGCLVTCVLDEVATWSFPAFRGYPETLRMNYPFRFDSSE